MPVKSFPGNCGIKVLHSLGDYVEWDDDGAEAADSKKLEKVIDRNQGKVIVFTDASYTLDDLANTSSGAAIALWFRKNGYSVTRGKVSRNQGTMNLIVQWTAIPRNNL